MPIKKKKLTKKSLKKKIIKKPTKRKPIKKRVSPKRKLAAKKKPITKKPREQGVLIGKITHYFPHVNAGVIKLKGPIAVGDTIRIKGHTTDLTQTIDSMQIDRVSITQAKKGDEIGLLVSSRVRQHDVVYKI